MLVLNKGLHSVDLDLLIGGGQMADSHYTAHLITRDGEDGREYMVIEYNSGEGVQIKFPGGTNNDHLEESELETLHRETHDETGLKFAVEPTQVYKSRPIPDKKNCGFHTKYGFHSEFSNCSGNLRIQQMDDQGDKLSPPFWRTAKELLVEIEKGGLFWSHRPMLVDCEKYLNG